MVEGQLLDAAALSKLKWRCRRGLLENDLFLEHFFQNFESELTLRQADGLMALMELGDNDLLDLNLGRKQIEEVDPALNRADVLEVLNMLKLKGQK